MEPRHQSSRRWAVGNRVQPRSPRDFVMLFEIHQIIRRVAATGQKVFPSVLSNFSKIGQFKHFSAIVILRRLCYIALTRLTADGKRPARGGLAEPRLAPL